MADAPEKIWLQRPCRDPENEWCGDVTWCEDKQNDDDTEYVRRALVEELETENSALRSRMVELLEILRQWEPDHASAEDRRTIVQAMYQIGILTPPMDTLRNMTEADFQAAHG